MFSLVDWLKSAKWYYLLAISVGGLIILTIIIKIIVVLVKKARRSSNRTYSKRGQSVTDLRVVTVTPTAQPITVSTKKAIIPPTPFAIPIPSAPPLEIEYFDNNNNNNDPQVCNSQGQMVKVPLAPIHSSSEAIVRRSFPINKKNAPQKQTSIPNEKQRPASVVEKKAEVLARYQPALSNYSRKQMKKELELAEAQELQLGTEISLEEYNGVSVEEYNSVEEQDSGSTQIWIDERNGANNLVPPVNEKKILVPDVFGPYNFIHIKAAEKIQQCYRKFIQNLEKEISALFHEQSRLITINKNARKL